MRRHRYALEPCAHLVRRHKFFDSPANFIGALRVGADQRFRALLRAKLDEEVTLLGWSMHGKALALADAAQAREVDIGGKIREPWLGQRMNLLAGLVRAECFIRRAIIGAIIDEQGAAWMLSEAAGQAGNQCF